MEVIMDRFGKTWKELEQEYGPENVDEMSRNLSNAPAVPSDKNFNSLEEVIVWCDNLGKELESKIEELSKKSL